jgi:hypothetical protein
MSSDPFLPWRRFIDAAGQPPWRYGKRADRSERRAGLRDSPGQPLQGVLLRLHLGQQPLGPGVLGRSSFKALGAIGLPHDSMSAPPRAPTGGHPGAAKFNNLMGEASEVSCRRTRR